MRRLIILPLFFALCTGCASETDVEPSRSAAEDDVGQHDGAGKDEAGKGDDAPEGDMPAGDDDESDGDALAGDDDECEGPDDDMAENNDGSGGEDCLDNSDDPAVDVSPAPCRGACPDDLDERPRPLPRPTCPAAAPALGDACAEDGLSCSYGNDPDVACRTFFYCDEEWRTPETTVPVDCESLQEATAGSCPTQSPEDTSTCTVSTVGTVLACRYGDVTCQCSTGIGEPGSAGNWHCFGAPEDPRCPANLPNLGEGCAENGVECIYLPNGCNALPYNSVFCFDGQWEEGSELSCLL